MTAPASALHCSHMNHLNMVVNGFDESRDRFIDLFGAQVDLDLPLPEYHLGLLSVGGVILEIIAPPAWLPFARYGPHWVGVEYTVRNVAEARQAVLERGIRIVRDIGGAFHTHPQDAYGVAFEIYDGNFHVSTDPAWQGNPPAWLSSGIPNNPIGCIGLKHYTVLVGDLAGAASFFTSALGGTIHYERQRGSSHAVRLQVGDGVVELVTPTAPGPLRDRHALMGDGIDTALLQVYDVDRAHSALAARGVEIVPSEADGAFGLDPGDTCGMRFEFSQ